MVWQACTCAIQEDLDFSRNIYGEAGDLNERKIMQGRETLSQASDQQLQW